MAATETKGGKDQGLVQDSQDRERMLSRREILRIGWTIPVVAMIMTPRSVSACVSPVVPPPPDDCCDHHHDGDGRKHHHRRRH